MAGSGSYQSNRGIDTVHVFGQYQPTDFYTTIRNRHCSVVRLYFDVKSVHSFLVIREEQSLPTDVLVLLYIHIQEYVQPIV